MFYIVFLSYLLFNQGRGFYDDTEDEYEETEEDVQFRCAIRDVSVPIVCGYCFETTIFYLGILESPRSRELNFLFMML